MGGFSDWEIFCCIAQEYTHQPQLSFDGHFLTWQSRWGVNSIFYLVMGKMKTWGEGGGIRVKVKRENGSFNAGFDVALL